MAANKNIQVSTAKSMVFPVCGQFTDDCSDGELTDFEIAENQDVFEKIDDGIEVVSRPEHKNSTEDDDEE